MYDDDPAAPGAAKETAGFTRKEGIMTRLFLFLVVLVFAGMCLSCGSSTQLEGVAIGEIQLEGEYAEEVTADLEEALAAAGATVNQSNAPDLVGTITWEWAGEKENPYPTLVKIFMQSQSAEGNFTITARYDVDAGAQPQDISRYRREVVERAVNRIAVQTRDTT